jgi:hypothetical protein
MFNGTVSAQLCADDFATAAAAAAIAGCSSGAGFRICSRTTINTPTG